MSHDDTTHLAERKISGEKVYGGVLLHVHRDSVRLPDGKPATREYIDHPGAVAIVPIVDGGRVLLERQFRYPLGAVMVGLSRAVMEYAIPYAKDREAFGEAIAKKQAIAFMLSDMRIEVDAMRWMVWKAASQLEHGLDATRAAHLARLYCAREAMKIADNGVQVLGGHGFIREHPVEMWYRNARTLGVLEGSVTC